VAAVRGECWSIFEQPARDGFALATIGEAAFVASSGPGRFDDIAAHCAAALDAAEVDDLADDPAAPAGAGVVWSGGFAFYDHGAWSEDWRDFPASQFVLPRLSIARRLGDKPIARLTLNVAVEAGSDTAAMLRDCEELVDRVAGSVAPESTTVDRGEATVAGTAPPEHYEQAVARATQMIRDGELEKVVLAREVLLRRESAIDVISAHSELRDRFPECECFAIHSGKSTLIGASPELLIRREGRRASTLALAGSVRRGSDAAMDDHFGRQLLASEKDNLEHSIVVRRIEQTLGKLSAWVASARAPELVKVKNIQHLATPIRAQLTEPRPTIELAGLLHPTPAVGGEPWPKAAETIKSLEGFDRGWYTGGVGWMDQLEDGEFHVALRSALVEGDHARLFVGAGIVEDSDPSSELAETEVKLEALLPVLSRC
jgi:salicylate biosynthesis isochorismate synthase/menaquinone-specific isochorismate synthase